jgi:hypothetical protein
LTTAPPPVSQLSGKCKNIDISQPYEPPWPVKGIAVPFADCSRLLYLLETVQDCCESIARRIVGILKAKDGPELYYLRNV